MISVSHVAKGVRGRFDLQQFFGQLDGHARKLGNSLTGLKKPDAQLLEQSRTSFRRRMFGDEFRGGTPSKLGNSRINPLLADRSCPIDPFGDSDRPREADAAMLPGNPGDLTGYGKASPPEGDDLLFGRKAVALQKSAMDRDISDSDRTGRRSGPKHRHQKDVRTLIRSRIFTICNCLHQRHPAMPTP